MQAIVLPFAHCIIVIASLSYMEMGIETIDVEGSKGNDLLECYSFGKSIIYKNL